jgi:Sigma-70, region 4
MAQPLPEPQRKQIFLALVDAQDHDMPVGLSRKAVAERFGVSEGQVRQIEREGLDNDWPPLGDGGANSG